MLPETLLCAVAELTETTSPIAINRAKRPFAKLCVIEIDYLLKCFSFCQ
jgi:hypothetical protein